MRRITSCELLDEDSVSAADVEAALRDIWRINQRFGGVSGCLRLLDHFLARSGLRRFRALDVGAGDGRLAACLQDELADRGLETTFWALDRRLSHLNCSRSSHDPLNRVAANALELPFPSASFELVMCNLFVHHFSGTSLRYLLAEMVRVASQGVCVNDLERRWLPYLFIRYAPFATRNPIARRDGVASVRQAYTRPELAAVASTCGASSVDVMSLPFFRLGLMLWKEPSPAGSSV